MGDQEAQLERLELVPGEGATLYLLVHKDMRKSPAVRLMMDAVSAMFKEFNDVLHGEQTHQH